MTCSEWFITLFCKYVLDVSIDKDGFHWARGFTQLWYHSTRIIITFWGSNLTTSNYCGLLWGSLQYTWILNAVTGRRNRTAGLHTENHTKFLPSWYRRHIGACLSINQYKVFRKSYEISAYLEKKYISVHVIILLNTKYSGNTDVSWGQRAYGLRIDQGPSFWVHRKYDISTEDLEEPHVV